VKAGEPHQRQVASVLARRGSGLPGDAQPPAGGLRSGKKQTSAYRSVAECGIGGAALQTLPAVDGAGEHTGDGFAGPQRACFRTEALDLLKTRFRSLRLRACCGQSGRSPAERGALR
jgi:hypothetical protein